MIKKGLILNDRYIPYNDDVDLLIGVLDLSVKHAMFQPEDVIVQNVAESCYMYLEFLDLLKENVSDKKELSRINRLCKKVKNFVNNFVHAKKNRLLLVSRVYDFMLRLSGAGVLHGFGVTNRFKDRLKVNPERVSIVQI